MTRVLPLTRTLVVAVVFATCLACGPTLPETGAPDGGTTIDAESPPLDPRVRDALLALSPDSLPGPPKDSSNAWADDPKAAAFGKTLFFDPLFAGRLTDGDNDGTSSTVGKKGETGKVACASCHLPQAGFSDARTLGKQISLGAGWGLRRAPSLLDVGQSKLLMWDGRRDSLYGQVFGPLESPVEMNSSRLFLAEQIHRRYKATYEAIFGPLPALDDAVRFPPLTAVQTGCTPKGNAPTLECDGVRHGMPGDAAEFDSMTVQDQVAVTRVVVNVGKAIGAYERHLECGPSRFDAWMHGGPALTAPERHGAELFVGKAGCTKCHDGPFLSDGKFHNVGLQPKIVAVVFLDANDRGAALGVDKAMADPLATTGPFSDGYDGRLPSAPLPASFEGAFRTPTLRCVAGRPSFMHTGQMRTLDDVVAFFSRGGDAYGYPGTNELAPIDLTMSERSDLTAFLRTLDGGGPAAEWLAP